MLQQIFDEAIGQPPPSGVDIDRVVRRQRRAAKVRPALATFAVAAVVAATAATVQILPSAERSDDAGLPPASTTPPPVLDCDIVELPLPEHQEVEEGPDPEVTITGMDHTGRYVVGAGPTTPALTQYQSGQPPVFHDSGNPTMAIRWDDGDPAVIPTLREASLPADVNADGDVVGDGWDQDGSHAWVFRDGDVTELAVPAGYISTFANGINADGDVVGEAWTSDNRHAVVVWPATTPDQPRLLDEPPGKPVTPLDITDDGVVVGQFGDQVEFNGVGSKLGVYMWDADGRGQELPLPTGAVEGAASTVVDGWAGGTSRLADPPENADGLTAVPVRWNLSARTVEVVDLGDQRHNSVGAMDPDGNVLLASSDAVFRGGQAYALPDPIEAGAIAVPGPVDDLPPHVVATNDDGTVIVGTVSVSDAASGLFLASHPVMWRC